MSKLFNVFLCLIVGFQLFGQNLHFEHVTRDIGLSQKQVNCIFQDSQGFLWFGTKAGLNRFDGYACKVFASNPFDSTSLSNNFVTNITEDREGRIWVATENGLNLFLSEKEEFYRYLPDSTSLSVISHPVISSMDADADGALWVATWGGGISRLYLDPEATDPADIDFIHFKHDPKQSNSLSNDMIKNLVIDGMGNVWVSCSIIPQASDVNKISYDPLTREYEVNRLNQRRDNPFLQLGAEEELSSGEEIFRLAKGVDGGIWIGTRKGMLKWDAKRQAFEVYPLFEEITGSANPFWGNVRCMVQDKNHRIWMGTFDGLHIFNPTSRRLDTYRHDPDQAGSISKYGIEAIFEDRGGIIWLGSRGEGLYNFDPKAKPFAKSKLGTGQLNLFQGQSIRSILERKDKKVLLCLVETGVLLLDRETQTVERTLLPKHGTISSLLYDHSGKIWLSCANTLVVVENEGTPEEKIKRYDYRHDGIYFDIWCIIETHNKEIWGVTNNSILHFDQQRKRFEAYPFIDIDEEATDRKLFTTLHEDAQGNIWIGSSLGLFCFDPLSRTFKSNYTNASTDPYSLSNNKVLCIKSDPKMPDQYLWVATSGGGICRLDRQTGKFRNFTTKEGLPDNTVYGILQDEKQNFWLSTNQGLSYFDLSTFIFKNYDIEDGLQDNEFNTNAYFQSPDGELFFGGVNGFNAFYTDEITGNPHEPRVVFTDFKIFNHSVSSTEKDSPLSRPIHLTDEIQIPYSQKMISFEVAALDYSKPEKNEFWYKLENFDQEWRYNGNNRTITFTNLDPGSYMLRVRGSNNDGNYDEAGTSLHIIIISPWYRRWWAFLAYFLLICGIGYYVYFFSRRRLRLQYALKKEKEEAIRLKELDRFKTRLYTNLTHEFRTPLTVILGMVEQIEIKPKSHLQEGLQLIRRNSERLLQLLSQLLDLSKLENRSFQLQLQSGDIISFLRYTTGAFQSYANTQNLSLRFTTNLQSLEMEHDPEQIKKIMSNLISNAIKFTPSGGDVEVQVSKEQGHLCVEVIDNGIGIAEKHLPHIFNRFYQVDDSSTRSGEGTGIGLAHTYELVRLMKGEIKVVSDPNVQGTRFKFLLPIVRQKPPLPQGGDTSLTLPLTETSSQAVFALDQRNAPDEPGRTILPRLLIIEDNYDVVFYLKSIVGHLYQLDVAYNGKVGIEKALEHIPDMIISDVMMPEKDGYEVCEILKNDERTSHIPIILLTAKADADSKITGLRRGADAYLIKPFDRVELLVRLEKLMERKKRLIEHFSKNLLQKAPPPSPGEPEIEEVIEVEDVFMQKVRRIVETHYHDEGFALPQLCLEIGMSRSQLFRKMQALSAVSPSAFIRSYRLNQARILLQTTDLKISEVAWQVGFKDPSHFSRLFQKEFGDAPGSFSK